MLTLSIQSSLPREARLERQRPCISHLAFVSKFCLSTFLFLSKRRGKVFPKLKGFLRIAKIMSASDNTSKPNKSCS